MFPSLLVLFLFIPALWAYQVNIDDKGQHCVQRYLQWLMTATRLRKADMQWHVG